MRTLNLPNPKTIRKKLKSSLKVLVGHKIILLATLGVGIFVAGSLRFRVYLTQMASSNTGVSLSHFSLPYLPAPSPLIYLSPSPLPSANDAVLGAQTDSNTTADISIGGYTPPSPYPSPTPIPTPTPLPSYTPPPTYVASPTPQPANSNSSQSCSNPGVPTYQNSVVYNPASVSLGSTAFFYIRLEDCNWRNTQTDTLNITLVSGDPSVKVNNGDLRPTTTVTTTYGVVSVPVWASVAGTYTFKITDMSQFPNFDVTTDNPPYGAPIAVFTAVAASSPSPTPSPSASPSSSPSPTPSSSPTPTPSPSASPSASPSNSPSPSPSSSPSASP